MWCMSITSHLRAKRESDQRISDAESEVPLSGDVALWNLQCHFERGHIACLMCDEVSVSRPFALTTTPMGRNTMKERASC